jgi:hypothetical protein
MTVYGVPITQWTDTAESGFAAEAGEVPDAGGMAAVRQVSATVAVTPKEAVLVAARTGLEARPDARKPKANANNTYFIAFYLQATK